MHKKLERTPFTYLIGWKTLDVWYYGVRYGKNCHPSDLWVTYFTSSPRVKTFREKFGDPDIIEIRKTFSTTLAARKWEDKVHHRLNVVKSKKWLNANYGNVKFDTTGHFAGKTKTGEKLWISTSDPRFLNGEIVGVAKNMVVVKNDFGEIFQVATNDESYLSGKLKSITCNTAVAYDAKTLEKIGRISILDSRWKTGEICGLPYLANHIPTKLGMLSKKDPKYLNGDFEHINFGMAPAKNAITGEIVGQVSCNDSRWETGEIVGISKKCMAAKCSITNKSLGNLRQDDPRWLSGEIIAFSKNTVIAKNSITGKSVGRVDKKDIRWKTGEIVGIRKKLFPQKTI